MNLTHNSTGAPKTLTAVKTRRADRTGSRYTQKRSRDVAVMVSREEAGVKAAARPRCPRVVRSESLE